MLLQAKKHFDAHIIEDGFFGQEINHTNYVETVISFAPSLFFGTTIAVTILVLSKHKPDTRTQFIDASALFKKETNNNVLTDVHIIRMVEVFDSKENVPHFALSVDHSTVAEKDYNPSISSYVEVKDTPSNGRPLQRNEAKHLCGRRVERGFSCQGILDNCR